MIAKRTLLRLAAAAAVAASPGVLSGCAAVAAGGIVVGATALADRRTIGAQTEDQEIESKAKAELPDRVRGAKGIGVVSYNRKVLLYGQAPSERDRVDAEAFVKGMRNVRSVQNELQVADRVKFTTTTNDSWITTRVKTALGTDGKAPATDIKVVTEAGVVYLMGIVTQDEGDRAAQIASRQSGVLKVVTVFEYITPEELARITGKPAPQPQGEQQK